MPIRVGKGRASIVITGPLADGIEADVRKLLGPVVDALKAEGGTILKDAKKHWPVATGKSADAWTSMLQTHPGQLKVEIALVNDVKYITYIRSGKDGRQRGNRLRSPLQHLIRRPVREATKRLKKELPGILGKHLERALAGGHG